MAIRIKLLILILLSFFSFALIHSFKSSAQRKRVPLTVLQSSERVFNNQTPKRAITAAPNDEPSLYTLDEGTGEVLAYERKQKRVKKAAAFASNIEAFAVGPQGNIYLAGFDSTLRIVAPNGELINRFPIPYPRSLATLRNGNVVIASPAAGKLLHLYSPSGLLIGSFGDIKTFDSNSMENEFLNRGSVAVGPADEIYYISTYAPLPYALKFTAEGKLLKEFAIEGDAVDFQLEKAKGFLYERPADQTGGFTVLTSASVDPATGHLWIAMNGLSTTGNLYEYDQNGTKIHEYALVIDGAQNSMRNVTHLKDVVVRQSTVSILTWDGVYDFKLSDVIVADAYKVKNPPDYSQEGRFISPSFSKFIKRFWGTDSITPSIPQGSCAQEAGL